MNIIQVNYQYPSPSMCLVLDNKTVLGLSPDLSRDEKVSFVGSLKHPLVYRDAMLILREIVISDMSYKKKKRIDFFVWLESEIERRLRNHEEFMKGVRENIQEDMKILKQKIEELELDINRLIKIKDNLNKKIKKYDIWRDYYRIERDFWRYIKNRDAALWWVLDPVITVHPDQVSFEAFSLDESTYGCLSIDMDEFRISGTPQLGTTNIDFSAKLAREMERFRTYTDVELSINPEGFSVDTGVTPEHIEKKIDLPESWIRGFNQVSAAAILEGFEIKLKPIDIYDICTFLRRHKAHKSPRYMEWIFEPNKQIEINFKPWDKSLTLSSIYKGKKKRIEKIWGRRRWLIIERIIPIAKSFRIILHGFGMPQFIIADLGTMKMTIGFTSWSANDWVKGTAFNIMAGFIGSGAEGVYNLLKEKRFLAINQIEASLSTYNKNEIRAGIGMMLRRGQGYIDPINKLIRFRQLCSIPLPQKLYEFTKLEKNVEALLNESMADFKLKLSKKGEIQASYSFLYRGTSRYSNYYKPSNTKVIIDQDWQIIKVKCNCREFKMGPRNISSPCAHILAIYIITSKFVYSSLKPNKNYNLETLNKTLM
ncbi:MAG: hypothetical protein ACFFEN_07715 [Candidatus Thorarchaeota archaeon]